MKKIFMFSLFVILIIGCSSNPANKIDGKQVTIKTNVFMACENYKKQSEYNQILSNNGKKELQVDRDSLYLKAQLYKGNKSFSKLRLRDLYIAAFREGHYLSAYKVGEVYLYYPQIKNHYKRAFDWFIKAYVFGVPEAVYYLAVMYERGLGVKQSYKLALKYYQEAVKKGQIAYAMHNIGCLYYHGYAGNQDDDGKELTADQKRDKSIPLFDQAVEYGVKESVLVAMKIMVKKYRNRKNYPIEVMTLEKLEFPEKRSPLFEFRKNFYNKKIEKNVDLKEVFAKNGVEVAKQPYIRGMILLKGYLGKKDVKKAFEHLQKAADIGNYFALYQIGKQKLMEKNINFMAKYFYEAIPKVEADLKK